MVWRNQRRQAKGIQFYKSDHLFPLSSFAPFSHLTCLPPIRNLSTARPSILHAYDVSDRKMALWGIIKTIRNLLRTRPAHLCFLPPDSQSKIWGNVSVVQACPICLKRDCSVLETQAKYMLPSPFRLQSREVEQQSFLQADLILWKFYFLHIIKATAGLSLVPLNSLFTWVDVSSHLLGLSNTFYFSSFN